MRRNRPPSRRSAALLLVAAASLAPVGACRLLTQEVACAGDEDCPARFPTCDVARGLCVADEEPGRDAGPGGEGEGEGEGEHDAGSIRDAGRDDGGARDDAGPAADAGLDDAGGPPDAGFDDAGGPLDAGFDDAGAGDDAGPADDGGFVDAGAPADAGFDDAGQAIPDAGPPGDPFVMLVSGRGSDQVLEIDVTSGTVLATSGTDDGLDEPMGIAPLSPTSGFVVASLRNGFLVRFDQGIAGPGQVLAPIGVTSEATGLVRRPNGGFVLASFSTNEVVFLGEDGAQENRLPACGGPLDVALLPPNRVLVACNGSNAVETFDVFGLPLGTFAGQGTTPPMNGPSGIGVGPDGLVYVVANRSHAVHRFDQGGVYIDDFVPPFGSPLAFPFDIAFDDRGGAYVTAHDSGEIHHFDVATKQHLGSFVHPLLLNPTFLVPRGDQ